VIRILLAEDQHLIRGALSALIGCRAPRRRAASRARRGRSRRRPRPRRPPACPPRARKDAPSDELADAIRRVADRRRFVDPDLVAAALEVGTNPLTEREADVRRVAAEGGTTEDIGAQLFLSPATVRNYLSNAIGKLGARNRIDAIRIAREAGWL
jgi:DNA-binding CsgD family transcriptional regulator